MLGLHFRSDTYFGQMLAARALPLLLRTPWLFGDGGADSGVGPRAVADLELAPAGDPRRPPFGPQTFDFTNFGSFRDNGAIALARKEWE